MIPIEIDVQVEGEGEVEKEGVLDKIAGFFRDSTGKGAYLGHVDVNVGDNISLLAVPEEGCEFQGWFEDNKLVSKEENLSFQVEGPTTLVAKFTKPSTLSQMFD